MAGNLEEKLRRWEEDVLRRFLEKKPERLARFATLSGIPVKLLYTPLDLQGWRYEDRLGFPGSFPFTRGVYPTMYRARLWTFRQYSGFGSAEETNQRYKKLLEAGQTGLSVAFDLPTQLGLDPDDPMATVEIGRVGVSIPTVEEMDILFRDIPLDRVSTSMTINATAAEILAMYIVVAEARGIEPASLSGTIQNDILKEYAARKNYIYPPEESMRYTADIITYTVRHVPRWNPISISGYHYREAGATAVEELALTLADGIEYVRTLVNRGLDVDEFAPRLSFFFAAHIDLFEEIAKFRAARRMWAVIMRDWFGARKPRSMWLRFHTQTSGASLTAQQPEVNLIRTTIEALAAVLGGTQSLHVNSYDEAWALPSEKAVKLSLRVQQVIAYESNVPNTVDPLAGSYFVEWLTDRVEEEAWRIIDRIESMGGMIQAIKKGYPQRIIAESAYRYQRMVESGELKVIGVNMYKEPGWLQPMEILRVDEAVRSRVLRRFKAFKENRDQAKLKTRLNALRRAAESDANIFPPIAEAIRARATLGEISRVLREAWGEYRETPEF